MAHTACTCEQGTLTSRCVNQRQGLCRASCLLRPSFHGAAVQKHPVDCLYKACIHSSYNYKRHHNCSWMPCEYMSTRNHWLYSWASLRMHFRMARREVPTPARASARGPACEQHGLAQWRSVIVFVHSPATCAAGRGGDGSVRPWRRWEPATEHTYKRYEWGKIFERCRGGSVRVELTVCACWARPRAV